MAKYNKQGRRHYTNMYDPALHRPEGKKDIEGMPDTLGFPDEERRENGEIAIYLKRQPDRYIVVGKFAHRHDGMFYVTYKRHGNWFAGITTKHDHLIMAMAKVMEHIEKFNASEGL